MNRDAPKLLMIIVIIVGSIAFFGPMIYRIYYHNTHKNYVETTATYVQSVSTLDGDGDTMYYLIYQYHVDGEDYNYQTDYSISEVPEEGSTITICYNPDNPRQSYSNSFSVLNVFQIIGAFFLFISFIILFMDWIWFRDILCFLMSSYFLITFITNHFYKGGFIIALLFFLIFWIASLMDFILYVKNNKFHPWKDIKKDIELSKKIRLEKKEAKNNLSIEEIQKKKHKIKKVLKGLFLFLVPVPLVIFIDIQFGYPNDIVYYLCVFVAVAFTFVGFFMAGMTLTGMDEGDSVLVVAGKVIDQETIEKSKNASFFEKLKLYNVWGVIISILAIPLFLVTFWLIFDDPLHFFLLFHNPLRVQLFFVFGIVVIADILYMIIHKKTSKSRIIVFIIVTIVIFLTLYFWTS